LGIRRNEKMEVEREAASTPSIDMLNMCFAFLDYISDSSSNKSR